MAGRPRQHVLESESRLAFSSVLPPEWVINSPQTDYGIDSQVQIFENGKTTPYFFLVQLKSTDKKIRQRSGVSYPFSIERLLEYEQYPLPVLLVLYSAKSKKLFFKWTHYLLAELELYGANLKTKKKLSVKFESELNGVNSEMLLSEDVREYFFLHKLQPENAERINVKLELNTDRRTQKEIESQLKDWLWRNGSLNFITIGNHENADLLIEGVNEWNAFTVTLKSSTVAYPFLEEKNEEDLAKRILSSLKVVLADALAITGRRNTALDLLTQFIIEASPITSTAHFIFSQPSWAIQYILSRRNLEALEIADRLISSDNPDFGFYLAFLAQLNGQGTLVTKKYRDFCFKAVEKAKDNKAKGIQSYNLASALRSDDLYREAVIHYCRAARYAPEYLGKSYWWAEIAGCLFLMGKYRWAEKGYRRSVELGEVRIPSRYLLGDSLLHQGRFEEALREIDAYLNQVERPFAGAVLQRWLANLLLGGFGNSERNIAESNLLIDQGLKKDSFEEQADTFLRALQYDPLSGLAWYNYRVSESRASKGVAFNSWLASIITNPNDTLSWALFVVLMVLEFSETNEKFEQLHLAVISEAWKDKPRIEDAIRSNVPEELVTIFFQRIEPLLARAKTLFSEDLPVLRRPF